jgi:hypothetical protein
MGGQVSEAITEEDEEIFQRARASGHRTVRRGCVVASEEAFDAAWMAFEAAEARDVASSLGRTGEAAENSCRELAVWILSILSILTCLSRLHSMSCRRRCCRFLL